MDKNGYMTTGNFIVFGPSITTDHAVPTDPCQITYGRRSTDCRTDTGNFQPYFQPHIQPCAFDNLPEDCKGKPMMLYCSCLRCSPTC